MINKNFKFGKVKNDKNVKMKHTKYSALQDRKKILKSLITPY